MHHGQKDGSMLLANMAKEFSFLVDGVKNFSTMYGTAMMESTGYWFVLLHHGNQECFILWLASKESYMYCKEF